MAVKTVTKSITPSYAKQILARGNPNRKLSEARIKQYSRDMLNSQWALNHQGIAFDEEGSLIDGQHRLECVARTGCTVDMMVTTGLQKASRNGILLHVMDTVDRGRPRSVADQLYLRHGWENSQLVASAAKVCAEICVGHMINSLSTPQTLLVLKHFGSAITTTIGECQSMADRLSAIIGTLSFARHATGDVGEIFATAFFSMEGLAKNHPALALRKWLGNHKGQFGTGGGRMALVRVIASAIHSFAVGETPKRLVSADGSFDWLRKQYAKKLKDVVDHIEMPEPAAV